jgi:hypothetical protein
MPEATSAGRRSRLLRNPLNSDGKPHPLENSLAIFTLVAGVISFSTGWVVGKHMIASTTGLAALLVGLYAQLISATRAQRMVIVTGLVAAFVGAALGVAHGGFSA